jgi:hypothetical protein
MFFGWFSSSDSSAPRWGCGGCGLFFLPLFLFSALGNSRFGVLLGLILVAAVFVMVVLPALRNPEAAAEKRKNDEKPKRSGDYVTTSDGEVLELTDEEDLPRHDPPTPPNTLL